MKYLLCNVTTGASVHCGVSAPSCVIGPACTCLYTNIHPVFLVFCFEDASLCVCLPSEHLKKEKSAEMSVVVVMSMLTTYLTLYTTLVHQGKGTEYPR